MSEAASSAKESGAARLSGRTYGAERIILDGGTFVECTFDGTTLVYFGGKIPEVDRCRLNNVKFEFEGPARHTVELLRWLIAQKAIDF